MYLNHILQYSKSLLVCLRVYSNIQIHTYGPKQPKRKVKAKKPRPLTDKERGAAARAHYELHHGTTATRAATRDRWAASAPMLTAATRDIWAAPAPMPDSPPSRPTKTTPRGIICRDDAPFAFLADTRNDTAAHTHPRDIWATPAPMPDTPPPTTPDAGSFSMPSPQILGHHQHHQQKHASERLSLSLTSPLIGDLPPSSPFNISII
jgi:hypothetical protein